MKASVRLVLVHLFHICARTAVEANQSVPRFQNEFAAADKNNDGKLSLHEVLAPLQYATRLPHMAAEKSIFEQNVEHAKSIFTMVDKNGDEFLDAPEFEEFMKRFAEVAEQQEGEIQKLEKADGSTEEANQSVPRFQNEFAATDKNNDGKLSLHEVLAPLQYATKLPQMAAEKSIFEQNVKHAKSIFGMVDANGDEFLDAPEFEEFMKRFAEVADQQEGEIQKLEKADETDDEDAEPNELAEEDMLGEEPTDLVSEDELMDDEWDDASMESSMDDAEETDDEEAGEELDEPAWEDFYG